MLTIDPWKTKNGGQLTFRHLLTDTRQHARRNKPAGVAASVFEVAKMQRPKRRAPAAIDPDKVQFHAGVPQTVGRDHGAEKYRELLERFRPGTWCDLTAHQARRLRGIARAAGIKLTVRNLENNSARVWRLDEPAITPAQGRADKRRAP